MANRNERLFIEVKDIMNMRNCSRATAYRELSFIRTVLAKSTIELPKNSTSPIKRKAQPVTIKKYCELMGLEEDYIKEKLSI